MRYIGLYDRHLLLIKYRRESSEYTHKKENGTTLPILEVTV